MSHRFTFELLCGDCDEVLNAECEFSPEVLPYPTSNHDDPRFADPGDPGTIGECPDICPHCGWKVPQGYAWERGAAAFRDWAEAAYEDAAERRWEDKYR